MNYCQRQCTYFFPEAFKTPPKPHVARTNAAYGGWNVEVDRLFFANGRRTCFYDDERRRFTNEHKLTKHTGDDWRDATVSSDLHPRKSTSSQPIAVSDGFHTSDMYTANGLVDPTVLAVQKQALATMKKWLRTWKPSKVHGTRRHEHRDAVDEPAILHPTSMRLRGLGISDLSV